MNQSTVKLLAIACVLSATTHGFVTPHTSSQHHMITSLFAKKKKGSSAGKGFGKEPAVPPTPPKSESTSAEPMMLEREDPNMQQASAFTSVEGGSNAIPTMDPNMSAEDRASAILRDQYGLRTREEQQEEQRRTEAAREQRKKLDEWKKKADEGEDFDIMQVLPEPVLIGIDRFLKAGLAICTVLFVLSGFGITIEAWSKATESPLPENVDNFIVNVIEPNFTPGLGVLLAFSISLGAFAAAQLSSASATYKQDR